jgi:hypothetical protein
MGKINKLVGLGWSPWYVRIAVLVAIGLSAWMYLTTEADGISKQSEWRQSLVHEIVSTTDPQHLRTSWFPQWDRSEASREQLDSLISIQRSFHQLELIVGFTLATGYIGFSLDMGYKWLRKRRAAHPS